MKEIRVCVAPRLNFLKMDEVELDRVYEPEYLVLHYDEARDLYIHPTRGTQVSGWYWKHHQAATLQHLRTEGR